MRIEVGDIWDKHDEGYWIVIPTNCEVDSKGFAIMGAGLALQAAQRFPSLKYKLGTALVTRGTSVSGNSVIGFHELRLICFPTWSESSDLELIERGIRRLYDIIWSFAPLPIYMPKIGCGLGGLKWEDVEPKLDILKNYVIIIDRR